MNARQSKSPFFIHTSTGVEWLLLAVFSALLAFHTLPRAWRTLNTDFPNYYLAAQLAHEGYDTSQIYDWRWFQREKDHRAANPSFAIDQPVVGLTPITPFSALFVWPLTHLPPLAAKHIWLLLQAALLIPVAFALRSLTGQPLRRIALLTVICFPLHRNLLYGQFYILLLALLVVACWAFERRFSALSGALIAIAALTKIFPAIFLLYFLRKRDTKALGTAFITLVLGIALSLAAFGWPVHRYYLEVVLPATLRGAALPPYALASSSVSTLLHRLFLYEPQWNPHPWRNSPASFAVLAPVTQVLLIGPILLLLQRKHTAGDLAIPLEWSAVLCATLAISTSPASYNFTLLIFPIAVLCAHLLPSRPILTIFALLLYIGIGYPSWNSTDVDGLRAIAHEPRLLLLVALSTLCTFLLAELKPQPTFSLGWIGALLALTAFGIFSGFRHQRNLYADYPYRLTMPPQALLSASPAYTPSAIETIQLFPGGYRLNSNETDQLSFVPSPAGDWIEQTGATSTILPPPSTGFTAISDARNPVLLPDGRIAYIRDTLGRGRLFDQTPLTPESLNVYDAASAPDNSFFLAASTSQSTTLLYHLIPGQAAQPLSLGRARYPSVSPDGRWLAFSRFQSGAWNLYLLSLRSQALVRLTDASCNQVQPSWEPDSKTLLYASDCGRALGFSAICRRKVLP